MQLNLFNPLQENTYPIATTPTKRKRPNNKRNPFNGMWLKAYVDALFNDRPVHLLRR